MVTLSTLRQETILERFIICEVRVGDTPAYQVFERESDWTIVYYSPTKRFYNPPTTLTIARDMLHRLQDELTMEVSREGGLRS